MLVQSRALIAAENMAGGINRRLASKRLGGVLSCCPLGVCSAIFLQQRKQRGTCFSTRRGDGVCGRRKRISVKKADAI